MAAESNMLPLGTACPPFALADVDGRRVDDQSAFGPNGLVVMFICNHCPYVIHVRNELIKLWHDYHVDFGIVAINSNDPEAYPEDAPAKMTEAKLRFGYGFPYLFDEDQEVARAFDAACTPDFFVFGPDRRLVYRGRLDASRPGQPAPVDGADLRAALEAIRHRRQVSPVQQPSVGCSIKWRPQ